MSDVWMRATEGWVVAGKVIGKRVSEMWGCISAEAYYDNDGCYLGTVFKTLDHVEPVHYSARVTPFSPQF
jgi:hypothetical protein